MAGLHIAVIPAQLTEKRYKAQFMFITSFVYLPVNHVGDLSFFIFDKSDPSVKLFNEELGF